jgi:PAS domain S-box-containing protein
MKLWKDGKRVYEFLTEKQIWERLIENIEDAVVVTDNNAVVEMINSGFTKLFGYTEEEALGRPVNDLITQEQAEAGLREPRPRLIDNNNNIKKKIMKSRKNGRKVEVLSRITPIMMDNESIGGFAFYRVL